MNTTAENTKKIQPSALKVLLRDTALFTIGGGGYYLAEVLFRGYSHWSMAICGGVCLMSIFRINKKMSEKRILLRALVGAGVITAVELVCGCIVNLALKWEVWDYSHLPMNILGQICLPFTLLWFGLCIPLCAVCSKMCSLKKRRE